jgi:hypothetical protein
MEEYELLPAAEGLVGKKSLLTLNETQKLALANWKSSSEYAIFQILAEGIIEAQVTAHLQVWKDKEAFERTGLVAVAMQAFYERLQKEVNYQYDEFQGEVDFVKQEKAKDQTSPEELIQRSFQ